MFARAERKLRKSGLCLRINDVTTLGAILPPLQVLFCLPRPLLLAMVKPLSTLLPIRIRSVLGLSEKPLKSLIDQLLYFFINCNFGFGLQEFIQAIFQKLSLRPCRLQLYK